LLKNNSYTPHGLWIPILTFFKKRVLAECCVFCTGECAESSAE